MQTLRKLSVATRVPARRHAHARAGSQSFLSRPAAMRTSSPKDNLRASPGGSRVSGASGWNARLLPLLAAIALSPAAHAVGEAAIAIRMTANVLPVMCQEGQGRALAACARPQVSLATQPLKYAIPQRSPNGEVARYEIRVDVDRKVTVKTLLY